MVTTPLRPIRASVILATYNQPRLLDLSLLGYSNQSTRDFEIVIADDGSDEETAEVIASHTRRSPVPIRHVWQPHRGFWKSAAVNRAVLQSRGAQLVFSDGDCVPARSFVAEHIDAAQPSTFVVGGHVRLSQADSLRVTREGVLDGAHEELVSRRETLELFWTQAKSLAYIALRRPNRPRLLGLNFSVDRASFLAVNGFDQTYRNSSKDDSDLRNRLLLAGVRPVSLWHRARVVHLFHPPNEERRLWREAREYYARESLHPWAPNGLRELELEQDRERLTGT